MTHILRLRFWLSLSLLACAQGESGTSNGSLANGKQGAAAIISPSPSYVETNVTNGGSISGSVTVDGTTPAPRVARATADEAVCGEGAVEDAASNGRVVNAIVWLEGVTSGKPRAALRRYELNQLRCLFEPRVQAIEAGGTLNVRSHDPIAHRTRYSAYPSGTLISVVSEVDAGQVVPDEKIAAKAGLVEVRCEQHPWTHGWVGVFDHPYFAVTTDDGSFEFDDVPPGTYSLVVWHERAGRSVREVTVAAGARVTVPVGIQLR